MYTKYQWNFIMDNPCVRISGFRDLVTVEEKTIRTGKVAFIVVCSIQTWVDVIAQMYITELTNASKFSQLEM